MADNQKRATSLKNKRKKLSQKKETIIGNLYLHTINQGMVERDVDFFLRFLENIGYALSCHSRVLLSGIQNQNVSWIPDKYVRE